MSFDPYRAARQFERMLPDIGEQNRLRATDPERYREYMKQLAYKRPVVSEGRLIATIHYYPDEERVVVEHH